MIQLDRTHSYNKESLLIIFGCLFLLILDSEIEMTSKSIFADWIRNWKSLKFFERRKKACVYVKKRHIFYQ